jgi:hypothetical protein
MAFVTADRVKDTSTTTGTGNITVSGSAPFGYRTFSTVLSVSDTFYYCIQGQGTSEWEVGLGTYTSSNQFARTTVLSSSASGSAVSFSSGTKNVFITLPAAKTFQLEPSQSLTPGAVLYGTGNSTVGYTAAGTVGQILTSNAAGAPTWNTVSGTGTVTSVAVSGGSTGLTTSGGPITTSGTITMAGTLAVASGGTGLTTTPANGALDIGNGTGFTRANLTAGANITITNTAGGISIAASGAGTPNTIANGTSSVGIASSNGSVVAATNGTTALTIDTSQNSTFVGSVKTATVTSPASTSLTIQSAGTTALTIDTSQNVTAVGTVAMASSFKRNRIINGNMGSDQRNAGAAQTITAAAALAYTVDRFYAYCTGANVTGQQVAGATANQYRYRFTGAASVTAIGFAQRIEAINSADLASTTATLSVDLANSLLTTVTWTAYYANTTDTFGSLASPTVTSIATGTFTVTSTVTRYNAQISVPSAATTGLQILFTVGAQTSGTWTIGNVQLEPGSVATPYERQIYSDQLAQCQRYYEVTDYFNGAGTTAPSVVGGQLVFKATKRAAPTLSVSGVITITDGYTASYTQSSAIITIQTSSTQSAFAFMGNFSSLTQGRQYWINGTSSSSVIQISAEL